MTAPQRGSKKIKPLRVALIGYQFMGKAHSHAFQNVSVFFPEVPKPEMKILCGRNHRAVNRAARQYGWEETEYLWKKAVQREDIDLVDISTPGHLHHRIALEAAKNGKHILCEKPLANRLKDAVAMLDAVKESKVRHMVAFNYRRVPAIQLARHMIEQGRLGEIYHWRGVYLQDWSVDPNYPLVWRLERSKAGSGPLADLGAHLIDLARYLVGEIEDVCGSRETFIKERPKAKTPGKRGRVTVEDAALFMARFENGALGSFETTRMASGRKNLLQFEINGSTGSLVFNLERLNELQYYNRKDSSNHRGFRTIHVTEPTHPYLQGWWPPGHNIGWQHTFVHEIRDFLLAIGRDEPIEPDFLDGVQCQAVVEAVLQSTRKNKWVKPASLWQPGELS
jgi:predicted dehydrogenase